MALRENCPDRERVNALNPFKANVSFSWKAVPQLRLCICKTPVSIVAVSLSHDARPRCGRTQLTTIFIGDQPDVSGYIGWSRARQ